MLHRLREVVPGKLYRGSAPAPQDLVWLKDALGICKIVSLDHESGEKINRACNLLGLHHVKLYINGDRSSLMKVLHHNLKKILLDDGPTYVHCLHGKDRTGLMVALFKCKYMDMKPEDALEEAKSLGFGLGVNPKWVHLYEKLIRSCKPAQQDNNYADIVSNEREYIGDNRDTFLDESRQNSFSPYLDHTKQGPADPLYNYIMEQSPTRQNYESYRAIKEHNNNGEEVPQVGVYNNDAGVKGFGPSENNGGFIYD